MVNIQGLIKRGINEIYVIISSEKNLTSLIVEVTKMKFFKNAYGWLTRNAYNQGRGNIEYLILNLESREIAFKRSPPSKELMEKKLFVHESNSFINAGPKLKLKF